MKVTLQTIADRVGVTRATVSLALRNDPQISAERRKEIHAVAEELGYRPNALVSSLMAHLREAKPPPVRTGLLYLVSGPSADIAPWKGHRYDLYYRGAAERAAECGFHLEPLWIRSPGMTGARIDKIIRARGIPGVLVAPPEDTMPLPELQWDRLSSVMVGQSYDGAFLHRVSTNLFQAACLATRFLKEQKVPLGRLILPTLHEKHTDHRWSAGYHEVSRGQKALLDPLITEEPEAAVEWVRSNPGCAVLGTTLVSTWLKEANLKESEDFHFVSLEVEGNTERTGIREPSWEIGVEAMDLLIGRIVQNRQGIPPKPVLIMMDADWQQGNWKL